MNPNGESVLLGYMKYQSIGQRKPLILNENISNKESKYDGMNRRLAHDWKKFWSGVREGLVTKELNEASSSIHDEILAASFEQRWTFFCNQKGSVSLEFPIILLSIPYIVSSFIFEKHVQSYHVGR